MTEQTKDTTPPKHKDSSKAATCLQTPPSHWTEGLQVPGMGHFASQHFLSLTLTDAVSFPSLGFLWGSDKPLLVWFHLETIDVQQESSLAGQPVDPASFQL